MKIEIPPDCEKIHVLFSGGVDSTLMLYLLLLEKQKRPELEIHCYGLNMTKNSIKFHRCQKILTELEDMFNTKLSFKIFTRMYILREFVQHLLTVNDGYVWSGCNKVLEFLQPTNYIQGDTPPVRGKEFNQFHIRPFINIDKKEIISQYINYNILNLLDMTYSCGFSMKEPCENCYFCLERAWGLEMCGLLKV